MNYPVISWKGNTTENEQPRRFLECTDYNFLKEVTEEPTRAGTLLNIIISNMEKLGSDAKVRAVIAAVTMT